MNNDNVEQIKIELERINNIPEFTEFLSFMKEFK